MSFITQGVAGWIKSSFPVEKVGTDCYAVVTGLIPLTYL